MKTKLFSLQDQNSLEEKKIAFHHNNHCAVRNLDILHFFKVVLLKGKISWAVLVHIWFNNIIVCYYPRWVSLTSG